MKLFILLFILTSPALARHKSNSNSHSDSKLESWLDSQYQALEDPLIFLCADLCERQKNQCITRVIHPKHRYKWFHYKFYYYWYYYKKYQDKIDLSCQPLFNACMLSCTEDLLEIFEPGSVPTDPSGDTGDGDGSGDSDNDGDSGSDDDDSGSGDPGDDEDDQGPIL